MTAPLSAELRAKLAKICGRLASDHEGERAAAALLASRLLREAGVTWEEALNPQVPVFRAVVMREPPRQPAAAADPVMCKLLLCMRHIQLLSQAEISFIARIRTRRRRLRPDELGALDILVARIERVMRTGAAA